MEDVFRVVFFKQKTAYEMRISDWSSDVCSSDLAHRQRAGFHLYPRDGQRGRGVAVEPPRPCLCQRPATDRSHAQSGPPDAAIVGMGGIGTQRASGRTALALRSEEHTSELQSLMRISYAVFCLTKKKHQATPTNTKHIT